MSIWLPEGVTAGPLYGTTEWNDARRGKVTASRYGDVMSPPRSIPASIIDEYAHLVTEPRYRTVKTGKNAGSMVQVEGFGAMVEEAMLTHLGEYVYGDTAKSYMMELIAATVTGQDKVGGKSAAMDRGVDMESSAIDAYEKDNMVDVGKGRILFLDNTLCACTPDGFVEDDDDGPGLIEVKCPESKRHLQTFLERQLPDEYVEQVHGQMWIAGRKWCDFVSYDDRFPIPMRLVTIRVHQDEELIAKMRGKVGRFAQIVEGHVATIGRYLADCSPAEAVVVKQALQDAADPLTSQPE